jgi:hypothetical protein
MFCDGKRTHFGLTVLAAWTISTSAVDLTAAESVTADSAPQLFVDDRRVAAASGVVRRVHACRKLPQPVPEPEMPWEQDGIDRRVYIYGTVLRDSAEGPFRMWYNRLQRILFATSDDGIHWNRPALGLVDFNGSTANNLLPIPLHSPSVILDSRETDAAKRYKMIGYRDGAYYAAHSPDGWDWQLYPENPVLPKGDTITLSQDPATGRYMAFHKRHGDPRTRPVARQIYLSVSPDMQAWSEPELVLVPDDADHAQARELDGGTHSEFYNMSAFPYGGQWLGLVTHFRRTGAPPVKGPAQSNADGPSDVQLVHSRDGLRWERCSDRSPVIPNGPHEYDAGCILGVANGPLVVGRELWLYYTAITTTHGGYLPEKRITIALAKWRLDGFVSLRADSKPGVVETVSLRSQRQPLIVNADAAEGRLAVEVCDANGRAIPGYGADDCVEFRGDDVRHRVRWRKHACLPAAGEIRLRFHLQNADLYSYRLGTAPSTCLRRPE